MPVRSARASGDRLSFRVSVRVARAPRFTLARTMSGDTKREKHFLYNSLAILLQAVQKHRTTVDLRNEATIVGVVDHADAYMNVVMRDCVFTDPRGDSFRFDMFFVQARNIRSVHIPLNIRIIPAIKEQLKRLGRPSREKRTFKTKRAQQRHREDLANIERMLENKNTETITTDNETREDPTD
ncbi:PREDICTED: U7 snRNA-associated Sm-like protein LSm10 [Vollenhovia emeryi]|uniref:U7 snRNA-associated Sm-like protein LSm10 n=1 Tax=Vollenhovia emeryi TaxID=411798 RepID=UPI0005F399D4|nr:PREDICTED: U7 snRNA-associated Sm-like protein LSm10 [Vollenhovia emeryi]